MMTSTLLGCFSLPLLITTFKENVKLKDVYLYCMHSTCISAAFYLLFTETVSNFSQNFYWIKEHQCMIFCSSGPYIGGAGVLGPSHFLPRGAEHPQII